MPVNGLWSTHQISPSTMESLRASFRRAQEHREATLLGETTMPAPAFNGPAIPLEIGKHYRLRDMNTKLYVIGQHETDPQLMVVSFGGGYKLYYQLGKIQGSSTSKRPDDAVMEWRDLARVQITGFENVYSDHTRTFHASKSEANSNVDPNKTRIACITLEREVIEGEGLYD